MRRHGPLFAAMLLALAGVATGHVVAYAVLFRCWLCHAGGTEAHASAAASIAPTIALAGFAAAIMGRAATHRRGQGVGAITLLAIQLPAFLVLELLERRLSLGATLGDHAVLFGIGLQLLTALAFARFARVVIRAVHAIRSRRRATRTTVPPRPSVVHLRLPHRAPDWNATGFLRAPPLAA